MKYQDLCDKSFITQWTLKQHFKLVHDDRKGTLFHHSKSIQEKLDVCPFCNESFDGNYLQIHVKTVHENLKPYRCSICNKSFGHKSEVKRHIKTIHEKLKLFGCEVCNKMFGHRDTLKVHVKTVHEKLKPHQCEFCKKYFGQKQNLSTHIKSVHK